MALTVNQSSGSQAPAGQTNLQAGGTGNNITAQSSRVQPGTPTNALTSGNGVSLTSTPLTTVNLNAATAASTQPTAQTPPQHHFNPLLFILVVVLVVAAIGFFWATFQSGKKHNQYT